MAEPSNLNNPAEEAYAKAEKAIAKAGHSETNRLDLSDLQDLDRIPPLDKLTKLTELVLNGTKVSELASIAKLTTLQKLRLNETQVSSLAPLAGLSALDSLDLRATQVSDVTPLATLTALRGLDISETRVLDIAKLANLTELIELFLSRTSVSNFAPLATLIKLTKLRLDETHFSNLTLLTNLTKLHELRLDRTQVVDFRPLSGLNALHNLRLTGTQISDVAPLSGLTALQTLSLSRTKISDITPLTKLTALHSLNLSRTEVSDITPLINLTALKTLNLSKTQVSDLAPVTNLTALQSLNVSNTNVSDLAPLANLVTLVDGLRSEPDSGGLACWNCPLRDEELVRYAKLNNPRRTIRVLNHLRENAGLPLLEVRLESLGPDDAIAPNSEENSPPPALPKQGVGPRFSINNDGIIGIISPEAVDRSGNDEKRLRSLHGPLKETAHDLVSGLTPRSNQYPRLTSITRRYFEQVDRDLDKIDFAILYGIGLQLEATFETTRRDIDNGTAPPLDKAETDMHRSLVLLHGPFILASAQGQELLADAERYELRREDLSKLREQAKALGAAFEERPDLVEPKAAELIYNSADVIGAGPHPERSTTFTLDAIANLAVTAGELSIALMISTRLGIDGLAILGSAWAYLRTKPEGQEALRTAEGIYAKLHSAAVEKLRKDVPNFLLDQQFHLRNLAQFSVRLHFVNALLDWLEEQAENDGKK